MANADVILDVLVESLEKKIDSTLATFLAFMASFILVDGRLQRRSNRPPTISLINKFRANGFG